MVVPAAGVVFLYRQRWVVGVEESVDSMQLPPGQGVAQHLTCFLDVEVTRLEKSQDVRVLRDLAIQPDTS